MSTPDSDPDSPPSICQRCSRELYPGRGEFYVVSILAIADPSPPVFTEDDLALDVGREIRRLIAQMQDLGVQEARDQVYRRLVFHMCNSCYESWIEDPTGS